jgi:hypothetical protein
MDKDMERGQEKEAMDPIMMDDEQTKEIIRKAGVMHIGRPYRYKMNSKKRAVAEREALDSDEEEVEDLCAMGKIEDILHATYEKKSIGHGSNVEEGPPFQI